MIQLTEQDRLNNIKHGVNFEGWETQTKLLYDQMKEKYEVSLCCKIGGTEKYSFCARGDFNHYELMEQFAFDKNLPDLGMTRIYPVGTAMRDKWYIKDC